MRTRGTRASATSAPLPEPLAPDAQDRPRQGLEPLEGDRLAAALAHPVGREVHLRERAIDPSEVGPQGLHDGEETRSLRRALRAVREVARDVDLRVVRVRITPLLHNLLAEVLPLIIEGRPQLGQLGLVDHVPFLPVARARGWDEKQTS